MFFNNRKTAGSGAGEHINIGHEGSPFAGAGMGPLSTHLSGLRTDRAAQGKKSLENSGLVKQELKQNTKTYKKNGPSTASNDPFA